MTKHFTTLRQPFWVHMRCSNQQRNDTNLSLTNNQSNETKNNIFQYRPKLPRMLHLLRHITKSDDNEMVNRNLLQSHTQAFFSQQRVAHAVEFETLCTERMCGVICVTIQLNYRYCDKFQVRSSNTMFE